MSAPIFLHIYNNGDIWVSNTADFTPSDPGTLVGTYRVNSDAASQKIGTLSGTVSSNLAASKTTGKNGTEIR